MRIEVPADRAHDPYGHAASTHAREIMAAGGAFAHAVYRHSQLSLREFEGARARTAEINGCLICQNFRGGRDIAAMFAASGADPAGSVAEHGPAPEEAFYQAVSHWATSPLFSVRERLAIEFAEGFGEAPRVLAADEAFWSRMKAEFDDGEIVDLANCVAAWVGLGRVAHVLGFDTVCLPFGAATAHPASATARRAPPPPELRTASG